MEGLSKKKQFCWQTFWKHEKTKRILVVLILFAVLGIVIWYYALYYHFRRQFQYGTKIVRLDSPTTCDIPVIDPFSTLGNVMIEAEGTLAGAPLCIGAVIKFKVEYEKSRLVRDDSDAEFWKTVDCCYSSFRWDWGSVNQSLLNGSNCFPIDSKYTTVPIQHINLDIKCSDKQTHEIVYRDQLPIIRTRPEIEAKVDKVSFNTKNKKDRMSVVILGLDSVSHQNFIRYMPKSRKFLLENLSAIEFHGFNKVGKGTLENLIAMFSGCQFNSFGLASLVEDDCKLLWKYYDDRGFRTVYFEDNSFNEQHVFPRILKNRSGVVSHYNFSDFARGMKWIDEHEMQNSYEDGYGCFDNQFLMDVYTQPIIEIAKMFLRKPYFHFTWFGKTTHVVMRNTKFSDDPLHRIMTQLRDLQLLKNTILFVVSDHGPWYGDYVASPVGILERSMPVLYVAFPKSFKKKYPVALRNMKLNSKRLTTHYDLYETLVHLANPTNLKNKYLKQWNETHNDQRNSTRFGQSLFLPVRLDRTCETANIPLEFCMCWSHFPIVRPESVVEVQQAATYAVIHLNSELQLFPHCARLELEHIKAANWLYSSAEDKKSNDRSSRQRFVDVTFTTSPSDAEFFVTVEFHPTLKIHGNVLRNNIYKGESDCISSWENATYAKTMCYCMQ